MRYYSETRITIGVFFFFLFFQFQAACTLGREFPKLAQKSDSDTTDLVDVDIDTATNDTSIDTATDIMADLVETSDIIIMMDTDIDDSDIDMVDVCTNVQCSENDTCCDVNGTATCTNVSNDPMNCGGCGVVCSDDETCEINTCTPPPEEYVLIPAGTFIMGSPGPECPGAGCIDPRCGLPESCPGPELGRQPTGETQHEEEVPNDLWVKAWPVTHDEWFAVMGTEPWTFVNCVGDYCPAEGINLGMARDFCNALSMVEVLNPCYDQATGELMVGCDGYRLPTHAEHEYFTRAGTFTAHHSGDLQVINMVLPLDPGLNLIAWYSGNAVIDPTDYTGPGLLCTGDLAAAHGSSEQCGPHRVAQKQPNPWGIYDTPGLVTEWLEPEGSTCMVAGCSWSSNPENCRAASIYEASCSAFNTYYPGQGLRPVRTAM